MNLFQEIETLLRRQESAALSLPLARHLPLCLPEVPDRRCLWARPAQDDWWLGLGASWSMEIGGEGHLAASSEEAERLFHRLGLPDQARLAVWSEGRFTRLHLPAVQFIGSQGATRLVLIPDPADPEGWRPLLERALASLESAPESIPGPPALMRREQEPDASAWMEAAEQAIGEIRAGRMEKLVLARRVRYLADRDLSASGLIRSLGYRHPQATLFAVDGEDHVWLGASPEVLLDRRGDRFFCEAVAGTVRRDPNPAVDRGLGDWLLRDPKSRREHELVVAGLREALQPFCDQAPIAERPRLLRLRGLQHLHTPIQGLLKAGVHSLEAAQALHPSAAVCGYPKEAAARWLARHEPLERGGYSGLTGWIGAKGDATLNVVLRCARIQGNSAVLYAGAGLVADSNSLAEWEETELKLGSMIEALQDA
ncbi:MAG: hypothetical protein A2286_10015 [Gammaproteobacteria bacterium RIFOXYA12_FULL_61_12]|nr:MAG: hypothetical protein A2286_10015 [Gammaproteobacteria bacterium RIFOXYA12_FULL_61_12]OGT91337.1 MAG: hypothetical protein A2514_02705 [Gammaproteobacteria bacterium RIFOXYD12_FULL_61_37]